LLVLSLIIAVINYRLLNAWWRVARRGKQGAFSPERMPRGRSGQRVSL